MTRYLTGRAIERINRRQLEEIGTDRSREKPINIINRKWQEWEMEKEKLSAYRLKQVELEKQHEESERKIQELKTKLDFLRQLKALEENQALEEEKIKIKTQMKQDIENKIEEVIKKEEEQKVNPMVGEEKQPKETKGEKRQIGKEKKKWKQTIAIVTLLLVLINCLSLFLLTGILPIIFLLVTILGAGSIFFFLTKKKQVKWKREEKDLQEKQLKQEQQNQEYEQKINQISQEKRILQQNQEKLSEEIQQMNQKYQETKEKQQQTINLQFEEKIPFEQREQLLRQIKLQGIGQVYSQLQNQENQLKLAYHTLVIEQKSIAPRLDDLAKIEEQMAELKEQKEELEELNQSMNLVKEVLTECYEKMKSTVTPKFTESLSQTVAEITNGKYTHMRFHDEQGLLVETETGNYVPATRLSVGTIDQLYLSLRLSIAKELTEEPMPILLDEAFAYFDQERLSNCLHYLVNHYPDTQIFIFTCTDREEKIVKKEQIKYNYISLSKQEVIED